MTTENKSGNRFPFGAIAGVVITTGAVFGALNALSSGLGAPIAALLLGLILTGALCLWRPETKLAALVAWAITAVLVMIVYLIVSRPATVTGQVTQVDGTPSGGLTLILTNADGVQQRVVTDAAGNFEIRNVPQGRYTIAIESTERLLYSGAVPSGWRRLFAPEVNTGGLIIVSESSVSPTPTTTTETLTPAAPSDCATVFRPICDVYRLADVAADAFSYEGAAFDFTAECARSGSLGLQVTFDAGQALFGGWGIRWINAPTRSADLSGFRELVFWVKGTTDDQVFQIGIKGSNGVEVKAESTAGGVVSASEWREFVIPLSAFTGIDLRAVENVNLGFNDQHGSVNLCLDDITFR